MRGKILFGVLVTLALLCAGRQAMASVETLGLDGNVIVQVGDYGTGGEPSLYVGADSAFSGTDSIMDQLYGAENYQRIADSSAQYWSLIDGQVGVVARYAGDSGELGSSVTGPSFIATLPTNEVVAPPGGNVTTFPGGTNFTWQYENTVTGTTFYSVASQNPDDEVHMVAFKITGGASFGDYVIAWEDLSGEQNSDFDFNDAVFEISGVAPGSEPPVPEPTTLAIWGLGMGLAGAAALRRRKQPRSRWSKKNRQAIFDVVEGKS